jgi:hypothetical protein
VFGNFLFSKFFGNSIDEITDGRGFEPLLFHIQGIFAVSALFQRAARLGFRKIGEKSFTKLWTLDCCFSRTKSNAFFVLKKGAENGGVLYDSKMAASH